MDLKTFLVHVWFFICFIFDATTTPQRFGRKKLRDPDKQAHVYRGRETATEDNVNKLSISTLNRKWATSARAVRRKATRTDAVQRQSLRKIAEKNVQIITNNPFIEFDMRRAFVPKLVVSKKVKSITKTKKPIENTHPGYSANKSVDLNKTVFNEKSIESDSETVNIDEIVLDRIQQLEKELIVMKDRVKNDTETIDDLKSKVLQKDKELTEFSFNNQSLADNKNTIKNQNTITPKEDFRSITPINSKIQRTKRKRVQKVTTNKPPLYVLNINSFRKNSGNRPLNSGNDVAVRNKYGEDKTINNKTETNDIKTENMKTTDYIINQKSPEFAEETHKDDTQMEVRSRQHEDDNYQKNIMKSNDLRQAITAGRKKLGTDPQTKDIDQIYDFENDNAQPMNKPDKDNPTYPVEKNADYDQLNVGDRNNKEEYGQEDPRDLGFGINGKDNFMNYDEYKKKLHEERISDGIDWKKFNPQSFLSQISSEIKARSRPLLEYPELPPSVLKSGRRMISDSALDLTKAYSLSALNKYGESKNTLNKITQLYAPLPPEQRKLILTTVFPEPTEPLPSNFDGFNTNNNAYPSNDFIPKNERRNLAPQAGKQKIILDSTELLMRSFLSRMNKGRPESQQPYDFEVIKQKMNRDGPKRRQMIHERVARRMNQKISGRRNMNSDEVVYDSQELFKDPFLNDSFI